MKAYNSTIISPILVAILSACSSWPENGRGGKAEVSLEHLYPVEIEGEISSVHGLRFDFELQKQLLDQLIIRGAKHCFPAKVYQAKDRQILISRLLASGMIDDAETEILKQRHNVSVLERKLLQVSAEQTCVVSDNKYASLKAMDWNKDSELSHLLNCDNQFASNSYKINPKYANKLIAAAKILKNKEGFHLHISGHTDTKGIDNYNLSLSEKRAIEVSQFLQNHGINSSQITMHPKGELDVLHQGTSDATHLSNRRVDIVVENTTKGLE